MEPCKAYCHIICNLLRKNNPSFLNFWVLTRAKCKWKQRNYWTIKNLSLSTLIFISNILYHSEMENLIHEKLRLFSDHKKSENRCIRVNRFSFMNIFFWFYENIISLVKSTTKHCLEFKSTPKTYVPKLATAWWIAATAQLTYSAKSTSLQNLCLAYCKLCLTVRERNWPILSRQSETRNL